MKFFKSIRKLFPERKIFPGHYNIKVVSLPDEMYYLPILPKELIYVIEKDRSYKVRISRQLERAGLGLRTIEKTPEIILDAVNEISVSTQHRTIIPWLAPLLKDGKKPYFTNDDYEKAYKRNINLDKLVDIIYSRRFEFKRFLLIDETCKTNPENNFQIDNTLEEYALSSNFRSFDLQDCPKSIIGIIKDISTIEDLGIDIKGIFIFIERNILPVFKEEDYEIAKHNGIDLDLFLQEIKSKRDSMHEYLSKNKVRKNNMVQDLNLIDDLNHEIEEIALEYAIQRITFDNADTRTAVAQSIIKALLFIGPITHLLEKYAQGIGKVFAATTDDILSETAELFALRGSGFSWKTLFVRLKILLPVFIAATFGAFEVEGLVEKGQTVLAGLVFGFSAVALSFTTAVLSIRLYRHCVDDLIEEKKLENMPNKEKWKLALRQDFTNPARLGLFLGAVASPLSAMLVFGVFTFLLHNGWILAILGSTETIVAGSTVLIARKLNNLKYKKTIKRFRDGLNKKHSN
jgi:hypothetical protein